MGKKAEKGNWSIKIKGVNYAIKFLPKKFWYEYWTPVWHKDRGPYISIGLWIVAFYRGY